jgi:hypothetical protein
MHYLRSRKLPRAGTGRSNARNKLNVIKSIPGLISRTRESVQKRASGNIAGLGGGARAVAGAMAFVREWRTSFVDFRHDTQGFIAVSWLKHSLRETFENVVFPLQALFSRTSLHGASFCFGSQ